MTGPFESISSEGSWIFNATRYCH